MKKHKLFGKALIKHLRREQNKWPILLSFNIYMKQNVTAAIFLYEQTKIMNETIDVETSGLDLYWELAQDGRNFSATVGLKEAV